MLKNDEYYTKKILKIKHKIIVGMKNVKNGMKNAMNLHILCTFKFDVFFLILRNLFTWKCNNIVHP